MYDSVCRSSKWYSNSFPKERIEGTVATNDLNWWRRLPILISNAHWTVSFNHGSLQINVRGFDVIHNAVITLSTCIRSTLFASQTRRLRFFFSHFIPGKWKLASYQNAHDACVCASVLCKSMAHGFPL